MRERLNWSKNELDRIDLEGLLEFAIRTRISRTLSVVKSSCLKGNIPYDMTVDNLYPLPLSCPVFGTPLNWMSEGKGTSHDHPTIDRMVPELGYVNGNVQIISNRANRLKNNASLGEIEAIFRYMSEGEFK